LALEFDRSKYYGCPPRHDNRIGRGSPAGQLYGECPAYALAVYLLNRYTVRRYMPVAYKGGLPGYRLKRVLDHIGDNLVEDLSLAQLAAVAGMSPHYFAEGGQSCCLRVRAFCLSACGSAISFALDAGSASGEFNYLLTRAR
jgi:hypothetical protein